MVCSSSSPLYGLLRAYSVIKTHSNLCHISFKIIIKYLCWALYTWHKHLFLSKEILPDWQGVEERFFPLKPRFFIKIFLQRMSTMSRMTVEMSIVRLRFGVCHSRQTVNHPPKTILPWPYVLTVLPPCPDKVSRRTGIFFCLGSAPWCCQLLYKLCVPDGKCTASVYKQGGCKLLRFKLSEFVKGDRRSLARALVQLPGIKVGYQIFLGIFLSCNAV